MSYGYTSPLVKCRFHDHWRKPCPKLAYYPKKFKKLRI